MKYSYFPGCSLKGLGKSYEESFLPVMRHLGIEVQELDDWNCCGATAYMAVDEAKACVLTARNLALAEQQGNHEVLAPCSACYMVLNKTKHYFQDYPEMKATIDKALDSVGMSYGGNTPVRHPLDALVNDVGLEAIKAKVTKPLAGLKVAPYYGCQIVRPYSTFDDQYNPMTMDNLLKALGAEVVTYPLKTKCCGGSLTGTVPQAGMRLVYILMKEARKRGADCLVTVCPLCQFNLDAYHTQVTGEFGLKCLPTLYFTQLMGMAFGLSDKELGLHRAALPLTLEAVSLRETRTSDCGHNCKELIMIAPKDEEIRIGFYVCHCGHNIAATIDCEAVAEYVRSLPNVALSRDYKYMCSDPGQELIQQDIKENNLNRIVVAACSPLLHEPTFRNATERAGLNPFYFQMVNIREHASWVHKNKEEGTEKAKALAHAAIHRVRFHKPLEVTQVPIHPDVLIVGAGIAGIHAALTLANAGKKVTLVERDATIGGHMAKFDKTFPTLDCSACILTPKMSSVKSHPNITLMTLSEVSNVDGYVGNYTVTIKNKPRYIVEDACVGCLECIDDCVYKTPKFDDEFNEGLGKRKPVYIPFPQATPKVVLIDPETCLQVSRGKCKQSCVEACGDRNAIDFSQKETEQQVTVGTMIVSTGFKTFDAKRIPAYGYGVYPNVYTALEIERLVNASGPTGGEVILRDGKSKPKAIGIIHCVGSRDKKTNVWCSRVCCMYSMKLAHLLREHSGAEIYNFYIDIRTPGKGYEEFYNKLLDEGVHFIRGRVGEVTDWALTPEEEGKLVIRAEDTLAGVVRRIPVDMVVLATGLEPQHDAQDVRRLFNMSCGGEGFFLERHPKLAPVNTFTDGVFLAGCCQGPRDVPDTVAQAGAAAAEAMVLIDKGHIDIEPNTAYIEEDCSGCKSCIPLCPYTAIMFDPSKDKATINEALCKGCGTCVASCPSGSIIQKLFEDEEVFSEIEGILAYE